MIDLYIGLRSIISVGVDEGFCMCEGACDRAHTELFVHANGFSVISAISVVKKKFALDSMKKYRGYSLKSI